jgi:hypothetical protein
MFGIGFAELIVLGVVGLMLVVGFVYLFMRRTD